MKKSIITILFLLAGLFPALAQELQSEEVPEESLTLKKGNIPPAVLKSAEQIFKENTQVEWGVFPYEFKDYGWVYNREYNEPIDHYEIHMKTKDGTDVYAVFESTGELIRYRTINKNAAVPLPILNAIAKTPYKDWKLLKGTEIVIDNQRKVAEHYTIKMEKGNQKKTLYYTRTGNLLVNK